MAKVITENGISATVIADSRSAGRTGVRLTTLELEYPRFILAELNTHRMLSKNSASSRAIPVEKMHEQINKRPAVPVHWGKNQAGMQANQQLDALESESARGVWLAARDQAVSHARLLQQIGLHKQVANRVTEPWMMMKSVVTATEWRNFLWLRDHPDAQPEIRALAVCVRECFLQSTPNTLQPGEWHVPYVHTTRDENGVLQYFIGDECVSADVAKKVSASCCAQVSYRKNDDSVTKAHDIFARLVESQPVHASPVEHQATPMVEPLDYLSNNWQPGITHVDRNFAFWSGNFRGWIQHRKLVPQESQPG